MAQRDYQDWGNYQGPATILELVQQEKNNVKQTSSQGFEGKPDFPKIDIYVPDDHREMDPIDMDWDKWKYQNSWLTTNFQILT